MLAVLIIGLPVAQCTSGPDLQSTFSLPAATPERPPVDPAYPAVHDVPVHEGKPLTAEEQKRLKDDLARARERARRGAGS
jgi:hypothetical protein